MSQWELQLAFRFSFSGQGQYQRFLEPNYVCCSVVAGLSRSTLIAVLLGNVNFNPLHAQIESPPPPRPQNLRAFVEQCQDLKTEEPADVCLVGNPENRQMATDFLCGARSATSPFRSRFLNLSPESLKTTFECEVYGNTTLKLVEGFGGNFNSKMARPVVIDPLCVLAANDRSRNVTATHSNCTNDRKSASHSVNQMPRDQCKTELMIKYQAWVMTEAMNCVDALRRTVFPNSQPLPFSLIFAKWNNESALAPEIHNEGGVGLGQMTSVATKDVVDNIGVYGDVASVLTRPENQNVPFDHPCRHFKDVLNKPARVTTTIKKNERGRQETVHSQNRCQLVGFDEGFARNAIYSLIHFLRYREVVLPSLLNDKKGIISETKINEVLNDSEFMDRLSVFAFSKAGPGGATSIVRSRRTRQQMIQELNSQDYMVSIDEKMGELRDNLAARAPQVSEPWRSRLFKASQVQEEGSSADLKDFIAKSSNEDLANLCVGN